MPAEEHVSSATAPAIDLEQHRIHGLPPLAYYIPNFLTEGEEAYLLSKAGILGDTSGEHEADEMKQIEESPVPKWKTVGTGRRLQYWGGTLSKKNVLIPEPLPAYYTQFPDLIARISRITDAFKALGDSSGDEPNQVLVNEYQPGQGISPHEDGPAYHPAVATVSLGSASVLQIYQYLSHTDPSPPLTSSPRSTQAPSTDDPSVASPSDPPGSDQVTPSPPTHTSATVSTAKTPTARTEAKPIAAIPMVSIYLEPRSLYIMSSALYTSHLHGILPCTSDTLLDGTDAADESKADADARTQRDGVQAGEGVVVANQALLDEAVRTALEKEGRYTAERTTRTSLTFRKVDKVFKGGKTLNLLKR